MEEQEVQTEVGSKLIKRIIPKSGHSCFEYNVKTNELCLASYTRGEIENGGVMKKVDMKEDCVYITALNFKNATRHLKKIFQTDFIPLIVR